MRRFHEAAKFVAISLAVLLVAACANEREPAQQMVGDIDAAMTVAAADAGKYVPDQLIDVQTKLDDLKTAFNAQDYKGVLARGPAILTEAQGLGLAAAAKQAEVAKELNDQWASSSSAVPGYAAAIQARIDMLSQKRNQKLAAGIDLDAAKSASSDASAEWSKAQGAFGNGNMNEAVTTAKDVKTKLEALAGTLKLELPGDAAP